MNLPLPPPPPLPFPTLPNPHTCLSSTSPPITYTNLPPNTPSLPWTFHTVPPLLNPQQPYLLPTPQPMPNTIPPQITHPTYAQSLQNLKPIPQTKSTYPKSREVRDNPFGLTQRFFLWASTVVGLILITSWREKVDSRVPFGWESKGYDGLWGNWGN